EESRQMSIISPDLRLKPISPIRPNQTSGLKIILMGTAQLDTFPQAKAAFLRAAATWESLITTPITIVINVDFGPNRFGTPFPQAVLGSTGTQTLGQNGLFPDVRTKLKSIASSSAEAALDDQLPQGKVPTDFGAVDAVFAPSALLRVLGF